MLVARTTKQVKRRLGPDNGVVLCLPVLSGSWAALGELSDSRPDRGRGRDNGRGGSRYVANSALALRDYAEDERGSKRSRNGDARTASC